MTPPLRWSSFYFWHSTTRTISSLERLSLLYDAHRRPKADFRIFIIGLSVDFPHPNINALLWAKTQVWTIECSCRLIPYGSEDTSLSHLPGIFRAGCTECRSGSGRAAAQCKTRPRSSTPGCPSDWGCPRKSWPSSGILGGQRCGLQTTVARVSSFFQCG